MEAASRRQSATTRVWGSIGDWEHGGFRRGHSLHNDTVRREPHWTGQIQAGCGGRLMELGVHAGEWSALPCGRAAAPPPRSGRGPVQWGVTTPPPPPPHTPPPQGGKKNRQQKQPGQCQISKKNLSRPKLRNPGSRCTDRASNYARCGPKLGVGEKKEEKRPQTSKSIANLCL
jgi:hypothetical protein